MVKQNFEVLREIWKSVEIKDGALLKTKYIETKWVDEYSEPPKGFFYVIPSGEGLTIRKK